MDEPNDQHLPRDDKRYRWPDDLCPKIRKWLTRVQRVQAHMRAQLLIYSTGRDVGGCSMGNDNYKRRAAIADRTILHDALALAIDELVAVFGEVQGEMDSATPTSARPGTPEKVAEMERRAQAGYSIFIESDAP